jgi:UDPglucose 6-dehydrogenase
MNAKNRSNICIIGSGYVGLVTGACLADKGNNVICVDNNKDKIRKLKNGIIPIYEPGLKEIVLRNKRKKTLSFSSSLKPAVKKSDIVFICVNTPPKENGDPDLCYVEAVSREIAQVMDGYKLIVEKSTVPVQTGSKIKQTIEMSGKGKLKFDVASNPEFLREGKAVEDFTKPDRIVIGVDGKKAKEALLNLYKPFKAPVIVTDINSAEIIKHASNSFLAMKISFINAVSRICEKTNADIARVAEGMGYDRRINRSFLDAGVGFGGSCFPKDLSAFIKLAEKNNVDFRLLKEVVGINERQKMNFVKKIEEAVWNISGKTICVLGLAFKPDTDDVRNAPSIDIIGHLQKEGARIKAYDPQATEKMKKILKGVVFCKDPYAAAKGSDCAAIITDWEEFGKLDYKRVNKVMNQPILVDGRNMLDPGKMSKLGFKYFGIGRNG